MSNEIIIVIIVFLVIFLVVFLLLYDFFQKKPIRKSAHEIMNNDNPVKKMLSTD